MRPLMIGSQNCDQGFEWVLNDAHALAMNSECRTLCQFKRQSGLYVAKLKIRLPEFFGRPC